MVQTHAIDTTPMTIVGEYGNHIVNGAGCGGVQAGDTMFVNAGVSASPAGFDQSTFTLYAFDDTKFTVHTHAMQNFPSPFQVFKDPTNTNTLGNIDNTKISDISGQIPSMTTRRDSHGAAVTINGKFVHVADRIQNVIEVFDSKTFNHVSTYDLVSMDGKSGRYGPAGACKFHFALS